MMKLFVHSREEGAPENNAWSNLINGSGGLGHRSNKLPSPAFMVMVVVLSVALWFTDMWWMTEPWMYFVAGWFGVEIFGASLGVLAGFGRITQSPLFWDSAVTPMRMSEMSSALELHWRKRLRALAPWVLLIGINWYARLATKLWGQRCVEGPNGWEIVAGDIAPPEAGFAALSLLVPDLIIMMQIALVLVAMHYAFEGYLLKMSCGWSVVADDDWSDRKPDTVVAFGSMLMNGMGLVMIVLFTVLIGRLVGVDMPLTLTGISAVSFNGPPSLVWAPLALGALVLPLTVGIWLYGMWLWRGLRDLSMDNVREIIGRSMKTNPFHRGRTG